MPFVYSLLSVCDQVIVYAFIHSSICYLSQYFIVSNLPCTTDDGNFQSYLLSKGLVREYYSCGLEYCLGPSLKANA